MKSIMDQPMGPASMSRSAAGKTSHAGCSYGVGKCGGEISGTPGQRTREAPPMVWGSVPKSSSRMGGALTATRDNRWMQRSHNPSGAMNTVAMPMMDAMGDMDGDE